MFKSLIITGLCVFTALAQTQLDKKVAEQTVRMGITGVLAGPAAAIPGVPYSAKALTQRVQVLADGNRISSIITNAVARDSKGRVYREESLPAPAQAANEMPHIVLIDDPVTSERIKLDPKTRTATKIPVLDQKKADEEAFTKMMFSTKSDEAVVTNTDLGTQIIEGLPAKGTRLTRIFAPGTFGNDLPLVITTETWFSPDLKILLMSKSNDPRMGETVYKLTNLIRGEPNPALFQIPSDFAVK